LHALERHRTVVDVLRSQSVPAADTTEEAAEILRCRTLSLSPSQRIEEGARLCKLAREIMRAGIRRRHPDYDARHVEMALARLLWGDELYQRARPDWPLLDP
jgi:hypothetical protein